jgi:hypothetical protein
VFNTPVHQRVAVGAASHLDLDLLTSTPMRPLPIRLPFLGFHHHELPSSRIARRGVRAELFGIACVTVTRLRVSGTTLRVCWVAALPLKL